MKAHSTSQRGVLAADVRRRQAVAPAMPFAPQVAAAGSLDLPKRVGDAVTTLATRLDDIGDGVKLAALTGSAVTGHWIEGWSDLDVFVVAEHSVAGAVHDAFGQLSSQMLQPPPVSTALALLTPAEALAQLMPASVLRSLFLIQRRDVPVLLARPSLALPVLTSGDLARAQAHDLPRAVVSLRYLSAQALSPSLGLRAVYKQVILVCRLLLAIHGNTWVTGCDELMSACYESMPTLPDLGLPALAVVARAHLAPDERVADAVVAAADRLLAWYEDQLRT